MCGFRTLILEILKNPEAKVSPADAKKLLDIMFSKLLHKPSGPKLQQLVDHVHARGLSNKELMQRAMQPQVPKAVVEGLYSLFGVANSVDEMLG